MRKLLPQCFLLYSLPIHVIHCGEKNNKQSLVRGIDKTGETHGCFWQNTAAYIRRCELLYNELLINFRNNFNVIFLFHAIAGLIFSA
jgi:hypothetical protein